MTRALDARWAAEHPLPALGAGLDKDSRGKVLVVGGSAMVPGATLLTGEAALRVGAGKVQLGTVDHAAAAIGVAFPESAVIALPIDAEGELAAAAAALLERQAASCDVLAFGPGMIGSRGTAGLLEALLDRLEAGASVVLDAGAIDALGELGRGFAQRANRCVITPHHGELARLLGRARDDIAADAEAAANEAAARFGVTVVLKDKTTLIVAQQEETLHHVGEAPGLGTAGSGDVLAGVIAGLAARGCALRDAAAWGVRLHGEAGRSAGSAIGTIGYLARDLLRFLPRLAS